MKRMFTLPLAMATLGVACGHVATSDFNSEVDSGAQGEGAGSLDGWTMTWSDEFEGPEGQAPDQSRWSHDVGGHGWGNNELQYHSDDVKNVALDGQGNLRIRALAEAYGENSHTSGRIKTAGLFSQRYGRFEARIKLPQGQGIWPAFWMLGDNIEEVGWPACGEIDIMEYLGHQTDTVHGTIHGPGFSGANSIGGKTTLADSNFFEDFHVFSVTWDPTRLSFALDGETYHTVKVSEVPPEGWVFNAPFFLILNVAVGGNWPGYPDDSTPFPADMLIDYVRVWERSP